jgi:hypothetical protein
MQHVSAGPVTAVDAVSCHLVEYGDAEVGWHFFVVNDVFPGLQLRLPLLTPLLPGVGLIHG